MRLLAAAHQPIEIVTIAVVGLDNDSGLFHDRRFNRPAYERIEDRLRFGHLGGTQLVGIDVDEVEKPLQLLETVTV